MTAYRPIFSVPQLGVLAMACCLTLLGLAGCRQEPREDTVITEEVEAIPVSGDTTLVVETVTVETFEEPRRHIEQARTELDASQPERAAQELEQAAVMLNRRAARAHGTVKAALENAAREGDRLARIVREDETVDETELDDFKARGDIALCGFHLQRAEDALDAGHPAVAGRHLDAAAALYEFAALHGEGVTEPEVVVDDRMRETAARLGDSRPDATAARREIRRYIQAYNTLRHEIDVATVSDPTTRP